MTLREPGAATREENSIWLDLGGLMVAGIVVAVLAFRGLPDIVKTYAADLRGGDYAGVAGYIIGQALVSGFFVFIVAYVVLFRRSARGRAWTYALILLAVPAVIQGGVLAFAKSIAQQHDVQMREAYAEMRQLTLLGSSPATSGETVQNFRVAATGDAGAMVGIVKDEILKFVRMRSAYKSEITALDLHSTMSPDSLGTDGGVAAAHAKIAQLHAIIKKYRAEAGAIQADARAALANLRMDATQKEQTLAGFDTSSGRAHANAMKVYDYEDAVATELDAMIGDLEHSEKPWRVRDKQIIFSSTRDLDSFRAHQQKVRQIAEDERAFAAQVQAEEVTRSQAPPAVN
ncbi:MAG TPA: hypothetical protein VKB71_15045 [Rhizomicrobium sp.]|nr:hypothetical protein [Rhizomicrobium sp.]